MSKSSSTPFRAALAALAVSLGAVGLAAAPGPGAQAAGNQITVFKHTGSQTSSQYFDPNLNQPKDYTSPADYSTGRVYVKLDVLSKPSNRNVIPQLCFWRHTETQKFKYETCAITSKFAFTSTGTVWIDAGQPTNWYKKGGSWDWSKQASLGRIMLKDQVTGKLLLTSRCGMACYRGDDINDHVPIKMTAEVIFVARGSQLAPPTNWTPGCPSAWATACKGSGGGTPPPTTAPPATTTPTTTTPSTTPGATALAPKAVGGDRRIDVTWNKVSVAKSYQFRYQQDGRNGWQWDQPTTALSRQVTGLQAGTKYNVQVRYLAGGTWQPWENTQAATDSGGVTATTGPPSSSDGVLGVTVAPRRLALDVSWDAVAGVKLYQFRFQTDGKGGWQWDKPTADRTRQVTGLTANTTYNVQVRYLTGGVWQPWETVQATTLS